MKFKDLRLGNVLETSNEFVINQYRNHADRYQEVREEKEIKRKKKYED